MMQSSFQKKHHDDDDDDADMMVNFHFGSSSTITSTVGGGFIEMCLGMFTPKSLGKMCHCPFLTSICFNWVGSTSN